MNGTGTALIEKDRRRPCFSTLFGCAQYFAERFSILLFPVCISLAPVHGTGKGMFRIANEAREFATERERRERHARRLAALQLACGVDFAAALTQAGTAREGVIRRVRRVIERERLRGAAGHADYSLDRHIALSESLAQLEAKPSRKQNGARRRRRC